MAIGFCRQPGATMQGRVLLIKVSLLFAAVLLASAGCQPEAGRADRQPAWAAEATSRAAAETQLKINQEALLRGATADIRLDAATVLLFSDNPLARQILIDTLNQTDNRTARIAVCRALVVSRETRRTIKDEEDFIEPLAEVLKTEDAGTARYAAEAALLFDYDEIAKVLETMAKDASLPIQARLNAIYAMKVQLDIKAITRLVELTGEKDAQIASAAREALRSIGVPVGADAQSRQRVLAELRTRGMETFQRDWMVQQEARISELERQRDLWRKLYLGALDRIYAGLGDDEQRGKLLTELLGNSEVPVRLWALGKVSQWRIGTQAKLPAELGPVLLKLISDSNRDVRLATAKLLSLTGELGSAERLAEQFAMEQDEEVKLELFVALGAACHYALIPTSGMQLSPELRKRTLEWAARYVREGDAAKAQRGAEVVRKLLEPGGLASEEAGRYLDVLAERFKQEQQNDDGTLKGELVGTMARLCAQSAYKTESAARFAPVFEKALNDEMDLVREGAVDGLISIDKPRALRLLAAGFINDSSQIVRGRVIELAGDVGGTDDLRWLWEKVGSNSESKPAWQAMLKIFNSCDVNAVGGWLEKLGPEAAREKLTEEQWVSFLELAERRAVTEERSEMVRTVREKLARLYIGSGQFERAAEYLGKLHQTAQAPEQKNAVLGQLVEVYLRWPKLDSAVRLVGNCLLERDLGANSAVVRSIDAFFDKPSGGVEPIQVLKAFREIKPAEQRPLWQQQLARWNKLLGAVEQTEKPMTGGEWKD